MTDVRVDAVQTRRQKKSFFKLPWTLYAGDPLWIPPLRRNQLELIGYRPHAFHRDAEIQTFLATRAGRPCGRIAAIIHHAHERRYKERCGYFGFFECVNDVQVSRALFDAALDWLRSHGVVRVRGPMNPSFNYEMGMLIDGFDESPTFMMTYNPEYYASLVEAYGGFKKSQDMYAYWGHVNMMDDFVKKIDFVVQEATRRFNIVVRSMDKSRFQEEIQTFLQIYNVSLEGHWGAVPLSAAELRQISSELRHLIVPQWTSIAEVDGKAIGCVFCLPDYNPRIKKINGRLFPVGFVRLLWNRRAIKRVRVISANVLPEYQRWGVVLVLISKLLPVVRQSQLEDAEFSWVMESNELSVKTLQRGGAVRRKTYRLYDRDL